jgi:hypothetical protein
MSAFLRRLVLLFLICAPFTARLLLSPLRARLFRASPRRPAPRAAAAGAPLLPPPAPFSAAALENGRLLVEWAAASCARYYSAKDIERRAGFAKRGKLSVVVGAYGRPLTLRLIVDSLRRQRLVEAVEVLVMDGGASPPLQAQLPDLAVDVWRAWPIDGGYHRVRSFNEGVRLASNDVIAFLDDDVVPLSPYWAHSILRALEDNISNPRANNVTLNKLEILEFEEDLSDVRARFRDLDQLHFDGFFEKSTVNIAFQRSAWDIAGGFSTSLDGVYGEEDVTFFEAVPNHPWHTIKNGDASACAIHVGKFYGNQKRCSPVRDAAGRYKMRGGNCSGVPLPEEFQKINVANRFEPDESWW